MNQKMCCVDFTAIDWATPVSGVRFKAFRHEGRQLRLVEFARGFVESDWCQAGHIGYVLDGSMELAFDDSVVTFNQGDGIFIPAGKEHRHKGTVLTDVFRVILIEDAM
jgi:quercetin dioxygenase-like cupin family protein